MADLRTRYDQEMVGIDHPTKPPTLDLVVTAFHGVDGTHAAAGIDTGTGAVVTDANSATANGWYYAASTASNIPAAANGLIRAFGQDSTNLIQHWQALASTPGAIYMRSCLAGSWSSWTLLYGQNSATTATYLPGGLMLQRGEFSITPSITAGGTSSAISFNTSFATAALGVWVNSIVFPDQFSGHGQVIDVSTFQIVYSSTISTPINGYWFALGY